MQNKIEPMMTRCWRCGKEVASDTNAIEFLYDIWHSDLREMHNVAIVCRKCFDEFIVKAFNGLQEI